MLMQILHGLILNAWKLESGYSNLKSFAASKLTPEKLFTITENILLNHATPMTEAAHNNGTHGHDPQRDIVHSNTQLLMHDLLYVAELVHAISDGNWGQFEDIMPNLAMMFRGAAGSNNYCAEIIHFIFNLKQVWTPEFAYVSLMIYTIC